MGHHQAQGPQTWTYFYLYVILDVYSRYVVGWQVAERESVTLADHDPLTDRAISGAGPA